MHNSSIENHLIQIREAAKVMGEKKNQRESIFVVRKWQRDYSLTLNIMASRLTAHSISANSFASKARRSAR